MASFSCALAQVTLVPGRVVGDIKFENVSAPLLGQLGAEPAAAASGVVYLRTMPGGASAAQGPYTAVNSAAGSVFQLGTLDVSPNVTSVGSNFTISVENLRFSSGATYRFGSPDSGSPAARMCTGVLPVVTNPSGTRCDLAECATLANIRIRLSGDTADLSALDTAVPATCSVQSSIQDLFGSGPFRVQAQSSIHVFSVSDLQAGYKTIPLVLRGNWPARIDVSCTVKVLSGQTGFVVLPAFGLTPVSASTSAVPACPQTAAVDLPIDLVLRRSAGAAQGLYDLVGYSEESARVRFGPTPSPFIAQAAVDPANPTGALLWSLSGAPEGVYPVTAWSLVDQRDKFVVFPARDNINGQVTVTAGATTDLRATFVAKPAEAKGRLTLFDLGQTDLATMLIGPFALNESPNSLVFPSTSFAQADGNPLLPPTGGASGIGGVSRSRLQGAYDATAKQAVLDYHLLLPGLGLPASAVDGSEARNTLWTFTGYNLRLAPPGAALQSLAITPATYLAVESGSPPSSAITQAPPNSICTGRADLELRIAPGVGTLFSPSMSVSSTGLFQEVVPGTTPVAKATASVSRPVTFAQRASSQTLSATLPAGLRYRLQPSVRFAPASAVSDTESTYVYLGAIEVPEQGVLSCGSPSSTCASLVNPSGAATQLSVAVLDAGGINSPAYCLASGAAELMIRANSDGVPVSRVAYVLDPTTPDACANSPTQVLCNGNCSSDPEFTVTLSAFAAGPHTLVACASDTNSCNASSTFNFSVTAQSLQLQCPAPIAVTLNSGESAISRTDPRIGALLTATLAGSCGVPTAIADNAPATFPIGLTTVTFNAGSYGTCSTPVTVKQVERVVSFISDDAASGEKIIRKRTFLDDSIDQITYSHPQQYHFAYNGAGTRMAIIPNDIGAVRIADAVTGGIVATFPVPAGYKLYDIDFNPMDPTKYAIVGTLNSNVYQHAIFIFQGSVLRSRFDLPLFAPSLRISRPLIAWSPDGAKISATFMQPAPAVNRDDVFVSEWNVANDQIVLPPIGANVDLRPKRTPRELIRELTYQDADWRVLGSSLTITRAIKRPGSDLIGPIWAAQNTDLDLTPDGKAAAYLFGFAGAPGGPVKAFVASPLDRNAVPTVQAGPVLVNARSIAVSSDATFIAIATTDKVRVYSVPGFSLVKEVSATFPRNLEFRPIQP
jgi:hypothetical protein